MKDKNRNQKKRMAAKIGDQLPSTMKKAVDLAQEKGASSAWLTVLPIEEHGFTLHKSAFRDALALRYRWRPHEINAECLHLRETERHQSCPISCARVGYVITRHNEYRDVMATLLREVTSSVEVEPILQPVTGERMNRQSSKVDDNC